MTGFGARLKQAVEASGLSMSAVSERSGLSRSHVGLMVHERSVPTLENAARVADVLGVTIDWLVTGKGPMRRDAERARSFDELVDAVAEHLERRPAKSEERTIERPAAPAKRQR